MFGVYIVMRANHITAIGVEDSVAGERRPEYLLA
jgi:hypothetical protein